MGQALASIGSLLGSAGGAIGRNIGTIIPGAMTGFGFLNNLLQQRRYNRIQDIAADPQKAARYTQSLERPLAAGLTAGVENEAQAALGERGLSQSPAISQAVYAQALAPYLQQQQALAAQEAESFLGSALSGGQPKPTDVSGPLAELMKRLQRPGAAPSMSQVSAADPLNVWYGGQMPPLTGDVIPPPPDVSSLPPFTTPDWSSIIGGFSPAGSAFGGP